MVSISYVVKPSQKISHFLHRLGFKLYAFIL